jgi:nucleoside 2-deoxyribosyltransferase
MKKRIYIAGPLFSRGELDFNIKVNDYLKKRGYDTFLPQEDGHRASDLFEKGYQIKEINQIIFQKDILEIQKSDFLVFIMDGRVPDEGACVELGIAFTLNKECIGLKTDCRCLMDNIDNPLITGALKGRVTNSLPELGKLILAFEEISKNPEINKLKNIQ